MPVPTKPNEQRLRRDGDFSWQQFAKDCLLNKYVLVVGSSAILNRDVNPEAEGNSQRLLFDLTLKQLALNSYAPDKEEEYRRLRSLYHDFTQLFKESNVDKTKVKEAVRNAVRDNDFGPCFDDEIEPSLMQMLSTRCFRIVLSTAIDPYMELAMEKVWGRGGFDVIQIENAQQLFKQVTFDEFGVTRPTLCHVFGKVYADKTLSENRFVLSENDAMEKISSWFENQKSNSFLKYVRNFRLLSVGCQLDDWMFRFFWFLLRGRVNTEADGQVAVEIKEDGKLKEYLKCEKVEVFDDARRFMGDANKQIQAASNISLLPRKENGVFISYAHEDCYIALPLFERLHSAGVNVWIDEERLEGGTDYERRIREAINSCKVFLPILSSQVKADLTAHTDRWYQQEWDWAQTRHDDESSLSESGQARFKVIPMVVGDYRFNEAYHQQLPSCITGVTAFETAKDNIEHLIRLINA